MSAKYYDWFEHKWLQRSDTKPTPGQYLRRRLHRDLIEDLIERHIENGMESVPRLYALLLIKTLCQTDAELMKEFGARVAAFDPQCISGHARSA